MSPQQRRITGAAAGACAPRRRSELCDNRCVFAEETTAIEADRLVLRRPLARAWQPGAVVYPAKAARISDNGVPPRYIDNSANAFLSPRMPLPTWARRSAAARG